LHGVTGSRFSRTVTGLATSTPVTGLPVGKVCSAHEDPTTGFAVQPDQNFPPVTAGTTQTVTFTNTRTTPATGTSDVSITLTGPSTANPGDQVTMTANVANAGPDPTSNGTIVLTMTLPAGATFVSGTGTGFTCGVANALVTCTRTAPLPAGAILAGNLMVGGLKPMPVAGQALALSFYVLLAPVAVWVGASLLVVRGLLALLSRTSRRRTRAPCRRGGRPRSVGWGVARRGPASRWCSVCSRWRSAARC
jgi:uncharacterized repeat protein (TIGR01451 family)